MVALITKDDLTEVEKKLGQILSEIEAAKSPKLSKIYTTKELAQFLRVSTKTINNWRESRKIEFLKINTTVLFTHDSVMDFLKEHRIKKALNN